MNTMYFTGTGRLQINDAGEPSEVPFEREAIRGIISVKEDTEIRFANAPSIYAKAGDLLISFYENVFPHQVIVIHNDQWSENIEAYNVEQQKIKEEWAKQKQKCYEENCAEEV